MIFFSLSREHVDFLRDVISHTFHGVSFQNQTHEKTEATAKNKTKLNYKLKQMH